MTERLLQFIWQFQYFNGKELEAISGEKISIIAPGQYNTNQGPDFTSARIRIDDTEWAGAVELHLRTSDWNRHEHEEDRNFNNVVLHVVWTHDTPVNNIPVVELKGRVSRLLLKRYSELMHSSAFIACEKSIDTVAELIWKSWKERLLAERLIRKTRTIEKYQRQNNHHWEETFWWTLARNFGSTVNADAFETLARSIPLNILSKHKNQIHQLEALLFGQAGLLHINNSRYRDEDDYLLLLRQEYQFLQNKYRIKPISLPIHFLRMRPGNFPTIRLAQLAMLIHCSAHLFSRIKELSSANEAKKLFDVTANDYWHYHYRFEEISAFKQKKLGDSMIESLIINTVAPMLFAYGSYHEEYRYKEKALQWLHELGGESNTITRGFQEIGVSSPAAYDSQALIELKNEYCDKKRCLACAIGSAILKKGSEATVDSR